MTLLDTLKSLLGLETTDSPRESEGEVGVTVEREPSPEADPSTEEAVKGVETEPETAEETTEPEPEDVEPEPAVSEADATETESEVGEPEELETEPEEPEPEEPAADLGTDESPDVLDGIGPAYAERLSDAGVETVADLAAADAADLAEESDIAEGRIETWIERARNR